MDGGHVTLDDDGDEEDVDEEALNEILESDFNYVHKNADLEKLLNAVIVSSPMV